MQLKVIKTDGSIEDYLHTKIIGTISNALSSSGHDSTFASEQLADAITYYLYNNNSAGTVSSSEIYSMIQAMLSTTGYDDAALVLNNYHFTRELMRHRTEVIDKQGVLTNWNKSQIVNDLAVAKEMDRSTARTIASMVEEKVLRIGISKVPRSLVRELVEIETKAMLYAQEQLAEPSIKNKKRTVVRNADTDVCLEQERKGICVLLSEEN
jgi:transcriptional regulator NrdR family protein